LRIIAATHRDLGRMVREGSFRQDLYYRLNVVRLHVAPLRDRCDDIVPLANQFLAEVALNYEEPIKRLSAPVTEVFLRYAWPGNVRELRNVIEHAFLFCSDRTIDVAHLPAEIREYRAEPCAELAADECRAAIGAIPRLADAERLLIARVLKVTGGNQSDAARLLDVERHRLRRKIVQHGLEHLARIRPR
jgi:DNA-binding NtrC family response regulator